MMFDTRSFALQLIQRNPNITNNPNAQEMIRVIQNGDSARGEQIANNLISTYGVSRNQAMQQAANFFGFRL